MKGNQNPYWPINSNSSEKGATRIIWAPHHSDADSDWLSFGMFRYIYEDILQWVKLDSTIEIVLKPHPALFKSLVGGGRLTQEQVNLFIEEWSDLPNTALIEGGDYGPLMAASDIMLTDGVSFLAEYMVFWEKPLIFIDSKRHAPFNEIGKMIEKASYIATNMNEVRKTVGELTCDNASKDILKSARADVFKKLIPKDTGASKRIVESVYQFFRGK